MAFVDGFWLPRQVRAEVLASDTEYGLWSFARGRPCDPGDEGAISARWPMLNQDQWQSLLVALRAGRDRAPQGQAYWDRLQEALRQVRERLADAGDPLHIQTLEALPSYTGYSEPMIRLTLGALELWTLEQLAAAFALAPTQEAAEGWQVMDGLPGRLRFYEDSQWRRALGRLGLGGSHPLFAKPSPPELVLGYGAGNVPGTALVMALLAGATALVGGPPPVVVVKNSRREPIFAPLVLAGLQDADPDLVAGTAVLVWDYDDKEVQRKLLSQADLVIAAASDETISQIGGALADAAPSNPAGFHAHGHKVSFSAIGREVLAPGLADPLTGQPVMDAVALLAALDSVLWDQHGCLSSRIHFVEVGQESHSAVEYAGQLVAQMRALAGFLPRGAWPRQRLYDRFDRYKLLETTGQVQVLSEYDDEFLVAVDERSLGAGAFHAVVNDCEGRVVIIRPVSDLMDVPERYLRLLAPQNLQSLSVAVGEEGAGLTDRFLRFADACASRGVTAIRTVGRGAFPQLAYSWDGLIPLDLVRQRPAGHFASIEFDAPYDDMLATYHLVLHQSTILGQEVEG